MHIKLYHKIKKQDSTTEFSSLAMRTLFFFGTPTSLPFCGLYVHNPLFARDCQEIIPLESISLPVGIPVRASVWDDNELFAVICRGTVNWSSIYSRFILT